MSTRAAASIVFVLLAGVSVPAQQLASDAQRREAERHHQEGRSLLAAEQFDAAIDAFERAVRIDHLLALAHCGQGDVYMALRRFPSAIAAFSRCREAYATLHQLSRIGGPFVAPAGVSLGLGSAHFRNGQLDEAERQWKAAVAAEPRLGEAHNNLAALYAMTGRRREAEDAVRAARRAGFPVNPRLVADIQALPVDVTATGLRYRSAPAAADR